MYHIPNDVRAKKSADLIIQGLYKSLEQKPLKEVKVNDIYNISYVSRATFYLLFDSVYDVLIYQCDLIIEEMLLSLSKKQFDSRKEAGIYCLNLWLKHEQLIKTMVDNNLYGLLNDVMLKHKDGLKILYGVDFQNDPNAEYYVYFLVSLIYTSFVILYREKGNRRSAWKYKYNSRKYSSHLGYWKKFKLLEFIIDNRIYHDACCVK